MHGLAHFLEDNEDFIANILGLTVGHLIRPQLPFGTASFLLSDARAVILSGCLWLLSFRAFLRWLPAWRVL